MGIRLTSGSQRFLVTQVSPSGQSASVEHVPETFSQEPPRNCRISWTHRALSLQVVPSPQLCTSQAQPPWQYTFVSDVDIQREPVGHGSAGGGSQYALAMCTLGRCPGGHSAGGGGWQ